MSLEPTHASATTDPCSGRSTCFCTMVVCFKPCPLLLANTSRVVIRTVCGQRRAFHGRLPQQGARGESATEQISKRTNQIKDESAKEQNSKRANEENSNMKRSALLYSCGFEQPHMATKPTHKHNGHHHQLNTVQPPVFTVQQTKHTNSHDDKQFFSRPYAHLF